MERRIVAQMLTCMDDLAEQHSATPLPKGAPLQNKHVVVIGVCLICSPIASGCEASDAIIECLYSFSK